MPIDTGFLNSNLNRAFPFVVNTLGAIPDFLIADFRAEILDGGWDPTVHRIFLAWVSRYQDTVRFGFRTDSPELAGEELMFEVDLNDPQFTTVYAESTPLRETLEARCGCSEEILCNASLDGSTGCLEQLCNPDMSQYCGPEHICNPNFLPSDE